MRDAIDKLRSVASLICLTVVKKSIVFLSSFQIGLRGFSPRDFHPGCFPLTVSVSRQSSRIDQSLGICRVRSIVGLIDFLSNKETE